MQSHHSPSEKRLFRAISLLKDEKECEAFFEDICTIKEIMDMAQRLDTACLLDEGLNYQTISRKAGVSSTTISRVARCLNYGSGGYKTVLSLLKEKEDADEI